MIAQTAVKNQIVAIVQIVVTVQTVAKAIAQIAVKNRTVLNRFLPMATRVNFMAQTTMVRVTIMKKRMKSFMSFQTVKVTLDKL